MAYDKLYFAYYDKGGKHCQVSISITDTPVTTYNIGYAEGDPPVTISYRGNNKNGWDETIIQGQEAVFIFYVPREDVDEVTIPLLESEYQDWKLTFTVDSVLIFQGWVKPENLYKRYEKNPPFIEIELSATDGLAELKEVDFRDVNDALYTGRYRLIDIIKKALRTTSINLDFFVQLNTYETNGMTYDSNFKSVMHELFCQAEVFFDVEAEKGKETVMSCWDVIEYTLKDFNCKFHQHLGKYYIVNYFEKNSNYWTFDWATITPSNISAGVTDNIVDITEYLFSPYIEQQKIHPLASSLITFKDKDIGGDITGELDLADYDTNWNIQFDSYDYGQIGYQNLSNTEDAVILRSNDGHDANYITLAAAVSIDVVNPNTTFLDVKFEYYITILEPQSVPMTLSCDISIVKEGVQQRVWGVFFAQTGNLEWGVVNVLNNDRLRIYESGNYNVIINFRPLTDNGFNWTNFEVVVKNIELPLFNNARFSEYDPEILDTSKVYKQVNVGGYAKLEADYILGDSGQVTRTGSFQWFDSSYHSTVDWQPYWGALADMRILDLCSRNILINRSRYKNYLRASIHDENNTITLHNIVTIEAIDYAFSSYSKNYKTGWIEAELVELIVSLDSLASSSPSSAYVAPNTDDFADFEEVEDLKKSASITAPTDDTIIYQAAHGFAVGDVIRFEVDSTLFEGTYYKAQADTIDNAYGIGVVSEVLSTSLFKFVSEGYLKDPEDDIRWTPGVYYFLSSIVLGGMVIVDDLVPGQIEQCIGFGTSKGFKVEIDARNIANTPHLPVTIDSGSGDHLSIDGDQVLSFIPEDYNWSIHSPDEIIGDLDEPVNVIATIDGVGVVDQTITAGTYVVVAINAAGETLPVNVPEMVILVDTTSVVVTWDAVAGASGYKVYTSATGDYFDLAAASWDYLTEVPATAGTVPVANTAYIYQSPFTIDNADTVEFTGEGIDVETLAVGTLKTVNLVKQPTDWDAVSGANAVLNKPTIFSGDYNDLTNQPSIPAANDVVAGDGMDFVTNEPATLGLPSTIDSTTTNAVTATSHTHELGNIPTSQIISGTPVEYGALYNWWAVTDVRNIAPSGWRVPNVTDINILGGYVDYTYGGDKLKETGVTHWDSPNSGATNEYGFNARGSGQRVVGVFSELKYRKIIWTSEINYDDNIWCAAIISINGSFATGYNAKMASGECIRLVKDATTLSHGETGTMTDPSGKVYNTICIGTQEWLASNYATTKYRNGDWITGFDGGTYTPISNANWAAKTTEAMCYYSDNEAYGGGQTPLVIPPAQVNSDWNAVSGLAQILNKPTIPTAYLPKQVTGLTLVQANWALVSGLYEYDLANANITATSIVEVIPVNADIDIVIAAVILPQTDSSTGIVKIYATNAPTANIGVSINIFEATT